ncbi:MaoC/PaaZ C-terminal domain-containing protein [Haloarchaeobius amylolyticus]|uniref:MaoC/PaaZ C-terminal domain-containing protein n=1 Tax=Haloarchaeobius amylolyticus TaxID=1198296 RepID=UPI00226F06DA|nr:MaoC/PaaZ C-terminal domain-containing protein [Haloarchaeobius amylolyticus]
MHFEDIAVGDTLTTAGRTITEADLVNFAGVSGDFNHLHTDAASMADSDFGERIAHGALVFSMMTGLLWQARDADSGLVALYGVDRVRFRNPAFVGDTIHVETEVVEKERREHPTATGVVRYEADVVADDEKTVLSCELLALVK